MKHKQTTNSTISYENDQLSKWAVYYSEYQDKFYKSPFIKLLFDPGHKFIANKVSQSNGVLLDIGSGIGYQANFDDFSSIEKYICLDINEGMLNKISYPNVTKVLADCKNMPFEDNSIDIIVASHVLEHISPLQDCISEIKRVLKPDGKLIVVLPCDPGYLWRTLTKITPSRWMFKKLGLDYDFILSKEHVNTIEYCLNSLYSEFNVLEKKYSPFNYDSYNINILCNLVLENK